jgi:hypothetical protein
MIAMCAPVARTGDVLAIVCSGLPSHALRTTGESVFPSRASTLSTCANSDSTINRRLSCAPLSPALGSRTSKINPSPLDRPEEMHRSANPWSSSESSASTWSHAEPLRPFPEGPTRIANSLRLWRVASTA